MSLSIDDFDAEIFSAGLSNVSLSAASSKVFSQRYALSADFRSPSTGDKSDRATVELVLDPRTRMMVFKMINRGLFDEMQGCISAGKEANVYCAFRRHDNQLFAIKIYKTSILVFKDREKYVVGEFRFRHGYNKSNPRKMVQLWAEKELRNLKRPSPILKNAVIETAEEAARLYIDLIVIVRTLFQSCKLVHADLSEYNILHHQGDLWIIDVSQAVEHDHPHALEFLRKDCLNVASFFKKYLLTLPPLRTIFDFVVSEGVSESSQQRKYLSDLLTAASGSSNDRYQEEIDERVFFEAYIPRTLSEVIDVERDIDKIVRGDTKELFYSSISKTRQKNALDSSDEYLSDEGSILSVDSDTEYKPSKPDSKMSKDERKKHKKLVKAEHRLRRQSKLKKSEKKRLCNSK